MNGSPDFPPPRLTRRAWLVICLPGIWGANGRGLDKAADTPQGAVAAGPGFVYRVEKNGRILFLASSLHRLKADAPPLPAAYESAYNQCAALWFENDPREANAGPGNSETQRRGLMSGRKRAADILTGPTLAALRKFLTARRISAESVGRMHPWYLGMHLMNLEYQRHGILTRHGVDNCFIRRADFDDKPMRGLEKASCAVGVLSKLSATEQDRNLADTLKTLPGMPAFYTEIVAAWRNGNEKDALRLLRPPGYATSETWRSLVAARNGAWVRKLDALETSKPVMVIVGLDHLIGPEGMIAQFAARGYTLSAVKP